MAIVDPVQTSTYDLNVGNNPITFGTTTNIDVTGASAVYGDDTQNWSVTNQGAITGKLGVYLKGSGTVTNSATGTISGAGYIYGCYGILALGAGTVDNYGKISGDSFGVVLSSGGTIVNETGAKIYGGASGLVAHAWAVATKGASGSVANYGAISMMGSQFVSGVYLGSGGSVTNSGSITVTANNYLSGIDLAHGGAVTNSGSISATGGYAQGIYLASGGTVTNSGSVTTSGGYDSGVYLKNGGSVTNSATGSISGATGIHSHSGGSLDNFGKINAGGDGVHFSSGGTIVNEAGGAISGDSSGTGSNASAVFASGASSKVTNHGSISITGVKNLNGVYLKAGGSVVNSGTISASGTFSSGIGLYNGGAATNSGSVSASGSYVAGVYLANGGSVTNSGSISASGAHVQGVYLKNGGVVTNSGAIKASGTNTIGVYLKNGGKLTNAAGRSISSSGGDGVYAFGKSASITDAGVISGSAAAVVFAGYGANTLTLQTGAKLIGKVVGSTVAGATNTLVLTGTGTTATLFSNFALTVQKGAKWTLGAAEKFRTITVSGGSLTASSTLTGPLTLTLGGVAIFAAALVGKTTFKGLGELELKKPYTGVVSGFGKGDKIDFLSIKYAAGDKIAVSSSAVIVETALGKAVASFKIAGHYVASDFAVGKDSAGHVLVTGISAAAAPPGVQDLADVLRQSVPEVAFAGSSQVAPGFADRALARLAETLAPWGGPTLAPD